MSSISARDDGRGADVTGVVVPASCTVDAFFPAGTLRREPVTLSEGKVYTDVALRGRVPHVAATTAIQTNVGVIDAIFPAGTLRREQIVIAEGKVLTKEEVAKAKDQVARARERLALTGTHLADVSSKAAMVASEQILEQGAFAGEQVAKAGGYVADQMIEQSTEQVNIWTRWRKRMGPALKYYVGLETVWHVALFAVCWRYQPLVALSRTPWGRQVGSWMNRRVGSGAAAQGKESRMAKFMKTPWQRATAEWAVINKVAAPVSWPTKLFIAAKIAERVDGHGPSS